MFVDIHNHILPGIDDGSPTMEYALEMARLAVADGTDILVATPHRAWSTRVDAPAKWVRKQVETLTTEMNAAGIPLTVLPGVEIPVGKGVAGALASGRLLTLGEGVWALIELPFDHIPADAMDTLKTVLDAGFKIVLAHPERNAVIQKDLAFVLACADLGINFQVTTGSILGRFGAKPQASAETILRHSSTLQIVIASDTHDHVHRPPNLMSTALAEASKIVGRDAAKDMVDARPRSMVSPGAK